MKSTVYSWKKKKFQLEGLKTNAKILVPQRTNLWSLDCNTPSYYTLIPGLILNKVSSFEEAHKTSPKHLPLQ